MSRQFSDYPKGFVETGSENIRVEFRNGVIDFYTTIPWKDGYTWDHCGSITWTGKSWCGKVNGKVVKAGPYLDTALGRAMFNFVEEKK